MVGGGGDEAACFDASLALDGVEADEIEGDVSEDGEVVSGMARAGAYRILPGANASPPLTYRQRPTFPLWCWRFRLTGRFTCCRSSGCPQKVSRST